MQVMDMHFSTYLKYFENVIFVKKVIYYQTFPNKLLLLLDSYFLNPADCLILFFYMLKRKEKERKEEKRHFLKRNTSLSTQLKFII